MEQTEKILAKGRDKLEQRLGGNPSVIGTMLGAKTVAGNLTKRASITVFVEQKRPIHELTRKERIPKRLHVDGQKIPTDVVELGPVVPQASSFSTKRGQPTNDYFRRGTLTSFCISEFGVFGLGCAHSLGGGDKRIETSSDPVRLWSEQEKDWLPVGKTVFGIHGSGSGTDPEFGFIDAAIFSINDSNLASRVKRLPRQPIARTIRWGAKVTGRTASQDYSGTVMGTKARVRSMYADVVIQVDPPGTVGGDSGMLWQSVRGAAVGIHAYGILTGSEQHSLTSLCMLPSRAERRLAVTLVRS